MSVRRLGTQYRFLYEISGFDGCGVEIRIFWVHTSCNTGGIDQHFGGTYCLKTEAVGSYEMLVYAK
jgi:hypothetical protein